MYGTIFRNVIFPIMEFYKGTTIQKNLKFLNKSQWWKPEQLEELQNKKLRALIRHAYRNVPYYHRIFKENNLKPNDIKTKEDLVKLPLLTKSIIRKNLPDLLARNIPKSQFMECHSSGSTGEPLKYYISKSSYSWGWAQTFRCWRWANYRLGDPYVKISLNPRKNLMKKLQDRLMNCTYIYASDINENTINDFLNKIKKSKIKIIRGYASSMYVLAKYLENIENLDIELDAIMTTGDNLFPHYRKAIETQFNCKVFDGYGGESTPIAFECEEHQGYHLCDENVIVEFLRKDEYVSPGKLGEIVFTSLDNYAMPFIRYEINDIGVPSDEFCSCGRGLSVMKSIEGRDTDIVVTPDGRFLVVHFFTILFEYIEGVDQFQVIQDTVNKLKIKIVRNNKFRDNDLAYIKNEIKKHTGDGMSIKIEFVDSIPLTRSGKRRFVISKVPVEKYL